MHANERDNVRTAIVCGNCGGHISIQAPAKGSLRNVACPYCGALRVRRCPRRKP